ncbi:MAG: type II secretion system F family protein [Candidatus Gastranaerophilales bacterium]|nr:type II secretion system F family protein [Candidatus Gastranaerophilales bacterium]
MIYFILSLIIGISAAIFVWVIFMLEKGLSPNTLRRLDRIKRKSNFIQEDEAQDELDINALNFEYKFRILGKILKEYKSVQKIKDMLRLADVKTYTDVFVLISILCACPFLLFLLTSFKLMSLFAFAGLFFPTIYLKYLINKRFLEFSKQFPDALNLMASSLRAGHPLFSAIDIVTGEMPKPISDVFSTVQKDISLGIDTKDAFYSMTKSMPQSIDLRFFITAVLIQKEVGGNLAELLDSLSNTIRERFKLMGQLRVQTAQVRLSGIIISVVPVVVLLVIFFMNPEYIKPLFDTKDGQIALYSAIGLTVLGYFAIKKISNIEI